MADVVSDGQDVVVSSFKDGALNLDAFRRIRTSHPFLIFEANSYTSLINNNNGSIVNSRAKFDVINATGGTTTHDNTAKKHTLQTTTSNGSSTRLQTRRYFRCQPGRGQSITTSLNFRSQQNNVTKQIGYYDDNDGVFFRVTSSDIFIVVRSSVSGSVVDTTYGRLTSGTAGRWNGDQLDGSAGSAGTINLSNVQLLTVDFQWLGVGIIRFYIACNGQPILVHSINNANDISSIYSRSGTLPLRCEVVNTGTGTVGVMDFFCCSIVSDAGVHLAEQAGENYSASNLGTTISINTTLKAIIAVRPATTYNGETNRTSVVLTDVNLLVTSRDDILFQIILNPTITAGTWSSPSGSCMQQNTTMTGFSGGHVIYQTYVSSNTNQLSIAELLNSDLFLTTDVAGTSSDTILIAAASISSSANVVSVINWKEFYR